MSKKTFIKKVCDNIVHGLILVLPKGAAIHKLLFSVKDARESTEKEDAYQELMKKLESKVEQLSSIDKEMIVPLFNTLFEWIKEKNPIWNITRFCAELSLSSHYQALRASMWFFRMNCYLMKPKST